MTNSIEITYPEALHKLADWVEANAEIVGHLHSQKKAIIDASGDSINIHVWDAQEGRPTILEDVKKALGLRFTKEHSNGPSGKAYVTRGKTNLFEFFEVTIFFEVSA